MFSGTQWNFCQGQEGFFALLETSLHSKKMPHAWLLTGPVGIGKRTLFYDAACFLLGGFSRVETMRKTDTTAPLFRQVALHSHPELVVVEAPSTVDHVRQLRQRLSQTAFRDSWRVVGLFHVHLLNLSSINALLKLLEDPPAHTVFFLTAPQKGLLPWTLRSRCMAHGLMPLPPPDFSQTLQRLLSAEKSPAGAALLDNDFFLRLAQGCVGRGVRLVQEEGLLQQAQALWNHLHQGPPLSYAAAVEFFQKEEKLFEEVIFLRAHTGMMEEALARDNTPPTMYRKWKKCQRMLEEYRRFHTDATLLVQQIFTTFEVPCT